MLVTQWYLCMVPWLAGLEAAGSCDAAQRDIRICVQRHFSLGGDMAEELLRCPLSAFELPPRIVPPPSNQSRGFFYSLFCQRDLFSISQRLFPALMTCEA